MKAVTIKGMTAQEIADGLKASMADGFKPTLAITFLSIMQDRSAICKMLDDAGLQIFGVTTAGEFIDGEIGAESTAIMLLDIHPDQFRIYFEENPEGKTFDLAKKIGAEGAAQFKHPAFIVACSGLATDGEMIVRGIEEVNGDHATIFGGVAGDDFKMTGTFIFTNGKDSPAAVIALCLDGDKISVHGFATSGWKAVGTVRTVTRSEGNVVYTIDDQPALDVVIKYMGVSKDIDEWKDVIVNVGSEFPMQLQREGAQPVMRAPLFANKGDRSLVCAGSVPQGSKVRFSLPPDFDVIDMVVGECTEVKNEELPEADAVLMFSCKARHLSLGPMVSEEIDRIKGVWNKPFAGFFSYGEFGKSIKGKHEFHNNTCSVVALKEI